MKNIKNIYGLAMMSFLLATIFTHHALTMEEEELTEQDYTDFLPGYQADRRYDQSTLEDYIRDAKVLRRRQHYNQPTHNTRYPTHFHIAAWLGATEKIVDMQKLSVQGINVHNDFGQTPLHLAVCNHHRGAVNALLRVDGIDVNALCNGWTTLLLAVIYCGARDLPIVQALVDAGADINSKGDRGGQTPLLMAIKEGYVETVRILLQAGANLNIPDHEGRTAEQVATNPEILALLAEYRQANIDRVHTIMQASSLQNSTLPNVASAIHAYL